MIKRSASILVLIAATGVIAFGQNNKNWGTKVDIQIKLAHNDDAEKAAEKQLRRLLAAYDVKKWVFTNTMVIDSGDNVVPHSHPVLTLDTGGLKDDELVLSNFVHEQFHWYVNTKPNDLAAAIKDLNEIYPKVPVGYPEGAISEDSTYNHLLVCYLEFEADKQLFGYLKSWEMLEFLSHNHYTWVYRMVQEQPGKIARVIRVHNLQLPK